MKVKYLFAGAMLLFLVGCSNGQQSETKSSLKSQTKTENVQSSKSSSLTSSVKKENKTTDKYKGEVRLETTVNLQRMGQFNYLLKQNLGSTSLFPLKVGFNGEEKKVNVWYEGDKDNFTVHYSQGEAQNFNAKSLNQIHDYLTLVKKTYVSEKEAQENTNHVSQARTMGLPAVDLGYGLSGVISSGFGQKYLQWNEGNWSYIVHYLENDNNKPLLLARQIVQLVQRNKLPNTGFGSANFNLASNNQIVKFQDENAVYTLESNNYKTLLETAGSVK